MSSDTVAGQTRSLPRLRPWLCVGVIHMNIACVWWQLVGAAVVDLTASEPLSEASEWYFVHASLFHFKLRSSLLRELLQHHFAAEHCCQWPQPATCCSRPEAAGRGFPRKRANHLGWQTPHTCIFRVSAAATSPFPSTPQAPFPQYVSGSVQC